MTPETKRVLASLARSVWAVVWSSVAVGVGTALLANSDLVTQVIKDVTAAYVTNPEIAAFVTTAVLGMIFSGARAFLTKFKGALPAVEESKK